MWLASIRSVLSTARAAVVLTPSQQTTRWWLIILLVSKPWSLVEQEGHSPVARTEPPSEWLLKVTSWVSPDMTFSLPLMPIYGARYAASESLLSRIDRRLLIVDRRSHTASPFPTTGLMSTVTSLFRLWATALVVPLCIQLRQTMVPFGAEQTVK